jgi:hypothetical protein
VEVFPPTATVPLPHPAILLRIHRLVNNSRDLILHLTNIRNKVIHMETLKTIMDHRLTLVLADMVVLNKLAKEVIHQLETRDMA